MDRVFSLMIMILLLSGTVSAFGSMAKNSFVEIKENSTAEFNLLFWGTNDTIGLSVLEGGGLEIGLEKKEVDASKVSEMVYTSSGYVSASSVRVYVRNVPRGEYNITISAKTLSGGGQLAVSQERFFKLHVLSGEPIKQMPRFLPSPQGVVSYIYIPVIFVVILIIAVAIYKYS